VAGAWTAAKWYFLAGPQHFFFDLADFPNSQVISLQRAICRAANQMEGMSRVGLGPLRDEHWAPRMRDQLETSFVEGIA
jgi:hypothetical protein